MPISSILIQRKITCFQNNKISYPIIFSTFSVTVNGAENALSFARFTAKKYIGERWNQTAPGISAFTRTTQQKLTCLKENLPLKDGVDLSELIKSLSSRTRPALEHLNSLMNDHLSPITGNPNPNSPFFIADFWANLQLHPAFF